MTAQHGAGADRDLGLDLVVTVALVVASVAVVSLLPAENWFRVVAALVGLFLLPGYALTTLLFPARTPRATEPVGSALSSRAPTGDAPDRASLTDVERAALSFGVSVALGPLVGLAATSLSVPLQRPSITAVFGVSTALVLVAGAARRRRVRSSHRYVLPVRRWSHAAGGLLAGDRVDTALNIALLLVVVVASASLMGVALSPASETTYTEAALLTEQPDGELVTAGYETNLSTGEELELVLQVTNQEGRPVDYAVVVQLQRLGQDGTVTESTSRGVLENTLADGETWQADQTVPMRTAGDRIRLTYLLYRGEPPEDATTETAYRHLSLSLSVDDGTA